MVNKVSGYCVACLTLPCWIFSWPCSWPWRYVDHGQKGLILEFGRPLKLVSPGDLAFVTPIISRLKRFYMNGMVEIAKRKYALTDGKLDMGIVICYRLIDSRADIEKVLQYNDCIEGFIRSATAQRLEMLLCRQRRHNVLGLICNGTIVDNIHLNGAQGGRLSIDYGIKVVSLEFRDIEITGEPLAQPTFCLLQTHGLFCRLSLTLS